MGCRESLACSSFLAGEGVSCDLPSLTPQPPALRRPLHVPLALPEKGSLPLAWPPFPGSPGFSPHPLSEGVVSSFV